MKYRYNQSDLLEKIISTAKHNYKHVHYKRTTELAEFYRQIMTGKDQDEYILSYKPNESTNQKKQVLNLYNSRTAHTANRIYSTFKEVERSDNVVDNLTYDNEDDSTDRKETLMDVLDKYNGSEDLKSYLHDAVLRLNFYDPNSFLVVEFDIEDEDNIKPYPFEVMSDQVADFEFYKGVLQYLTVLQPCEVCERKIPIDPTSHRSGFEKMEADTRQGRKYTMYGPDVAFRLTELGEMDRAEYEDDDITGEIIEIEDADSNKTYLWHFEEFETLSQAVPAIRVGYMRDPETNWETSAGILQPAEHIFIEQMRVKREYDLHRALHGFLQKYAYVEECDFEYIDKEEGVRDSCAGGTMRIKGDTCPKCNGSGKKVHTTVQDVILIKQPASGGLEDRIPLKEMVHYVEIPQHIIEGHKQDLKDIEKDAALSIFNSNVFDRSEIAVTATEKRLNLQSVYNVLADYGKRWSEIYRFTVDQIAIYLDIFEGLIVEHDFGNDFKMETLEELLDQRKAAVNSGSPYPVIQSIDVSILSKQNQDNLEMVEKIKAKEKWRPFKDKKDSEVVMIITMLPENHPHRVLWIHFDQIFEDIFNDDRYANFHRFPYKAQKMIVEQKVNGVIEEEQELFSTPNFRESIADE